MASTGVEGEGKWKGWDMPLSRKGKGGRTFTCFWDLKIVCTGVGKWMLGAGGAMKIAAVKVAAPTPLLGEIWDLALSPSPDSAILGGLGMCCTRRRISCAVSLPLPCKFHSQSGGKKIPLWHLSPCKKRLHITPAFVIFDE